MISCAPTQTKLRQFSIKYQCPTIFNLPSNEIKESLSYSSFTKKLIFDFNLFLQSIKYESHHVTHPHIYRTLQTGGGLIFEIILMASCHSSNNLSFLLYHCYFLKNSVKSVVSNKLLCLLHVYLFVASLCYNRYQCVFLCVVFCWLEESKE